MASGKVSSPDVSGQIEQVNREIRALLRQKSEISVAETLTPDQVFENALNRHKLADFSRLSAMVTARMSRASAGSFREVAEALRLEVLKVLRKYGGTDPSELRRLRGETATAIRRGSAVVERLLGPPGRFLISEGRRGSAGQGGEVEARGKG